ncbi:MAG: LPP20 family lipoprotein [Arcobacteraceae bacterium]|nr:LPP20 family lipoprotein [Arcobacteraceae bacterium]
MKLINLFFLFTISVLLFAGCSNDKVSNTKTVVVNSGEPKWILDPYINLPKGSIAAVGFAREHFKGKSAQRKLAISRAIDEIATQVKTTVNNVTLRRGTKSSSSMNTTSLQSVDNVNIKTKVMDVYVDIKNNIYVLVVQVD